MNNNKMKWFLASLFLFGLSGCSLSAADNLIKSDGTDDQSWQNVEKLPIVTEDVPVDDNFSTEIIDNDEQRNDLADVPLVTIDTNRCIGCGKCARIASDYFVMTNRTATVIGTGGINGDVRQAAESCPVGAISII